MARAFTKIELLVTGAIIFLGLGCLGFAVPLQFVFYLCFGWFGFVRRVFPNVRVNWDSVGLAVVALIGFAIGLHFFLRWLRSTRHGGAIDVQLQPAWRVRSSASVLLLIVMMFVAGISMVGITHQMMWLATSPKPLMGLGTEAVPRMQSSNNLHQIGIAFHNYHGDHGTLSPGATIKENGRLLHGWQTRLLPYLEEEALYNKIDLGKPWDAPANAPAFRKKVDVYIIPKRGTPEPQQDGYALTHYSGNVHVIGGTRALKFAELTDGTANTLLAGEVRENFRKWGSPTNWRDPVLGINRSPDGFGSPFTGGAQFLIGDGSVRFLSETIDPAVLKALSTPAGSEKVPEDY